MTRGTPISLPGAQHAEMLKADILARTKTVS